MIRIAALLALTLSMILAPVMLGSPASADHLPEGDFGTMSGAGWTGLEWSMDEGSHNGVDVNFANYECCNFLFWGSIQYVGVKYTNKWNFDHLCHYIDNSIPSNPPEPAIPECAAITDMTLTESATSVKISAEYHWPEVYEYVQSWEFTDTGTAKFHLRFFGPGQCEGDNCSSYWPIWRMDLDVDSFSDNKFFECVGGAWQARTTEGTFVSTGTGDYCTGKEWRLRSGTSGAYKFINMWPVPRDEDSSKHLNPPRMHAVVSKSGEWDGGAGVNSYWPDEHVDGDSINGADIVVWYEARLKWKEACERGGAEQCYTGFRSVPVNYD